MIKKRKISKTKLYWSLQILGWSCMGITGILNQLFVGKVTLDWEIIISSLLASSICLGIAHFYRKICIKATTFDHTYLHVLLQGIKAILIMSLCMVAVSMLVIKRYYPEYFSPLFALIQFINYGTYFGAWVTIYFFFKLLERNKKISEDRLLADARKKHAELELLKSQLNPDFLFNTLYSIKSLAVSNQELARETIIKLSELIRFSLNYEKSPLISIRQEMEEVEKYLELEKIRFGDRLHFKLEAVQAVQDLKIPTAMVLTLAENAIKHGITQLPDGGEIDIKASLAPNHIKIEVYNTGELKGDLNKGIGLKNIKKRLYNLFGEGAEFSLSSPHPQWVCAALIYPLNLTKTCVTKQSSSMTNLSPLPNWK